MTAIRLADFDTWRPGYGSASVKVYKAGTTTLADLYSDEALSVSIANPQTLSSLVSAGIDYGKWAQAVYADEAVYLEINTTDQTGVIRPPLTTLVAQDASKATVQAASGSENIEFEDVLDRIVHATDHGTLDDSDSATNTATLTAAIGVAAGNGGGTVIIPAGTFPFTQLTLSEGVVLMGQEREATVLQSQTDDNVVTLGGDRAGLARLTLDGIDLTVGSVGVFGKAKNEVVFQDVLVKRFEVGLHFKGARRGNWRDLFVDNCATGVKGHGDTDSGNGADGDEFVHNRWTGGRVSTCTTAGVDLSYEDDACRHNTISGVGFESNTGKAVNVNGAQHTRLIGCWWTGNTTDIAVDDDSDISVDGNANKVIGLFLQGGSMNGGAATFTGLCQTVQLWGMEIGDVDFTLTAPDQPVLLIDCVEDSSVTISGDGEKFMRRKLNDHGSVAAVTTGNTATKVWAMTLEPGQVVLLEAKVIARQQNGTDRAAYHIAVGAYRPGSSLVYENQTVNFTVGDVLTGGTSGATARILADSDSGTTGTLTLGDIVGAFTDGETITDDSGGSAEANGALSAGNVSLDTVGVSSYRTAYEVDTDYACVFAANGPEVELRVTGDTSKVVEWIGEVTTVS